MADEFTVECQTAQATMVRHIAHGHRYVFHVTEEPIEACCSSVQCRQADGIFAPLSRGLTRAFAEREARKAGLSD
jgi:hypothetical protein